jgi:predicted short-subunit dehydrogenase-like oxidoreductase (DUF2520 family)
MFQKDKLRIGIIGTGNVAWHFCRLLPASGAEVTGVLVRNSMKAQNKLLSLQFDAPLVDDVVALQSSADIMLIAVSDSSIREVAARLQKFRGIVLHTAGSVSLTDLTALCPDAGVFYPLQTLTKGEPVEARDIPLCIEAATPAIENLLLDIATRMGCPAVRMNSGQRLLIHVAAVISCNFSNHLNVLAQQVMKAGNSDFSLLLPLIRETTRKLQGVDPSGAQTGPAVRGDRQTIAKHLEALNDMPEIQRVYRELSDSIIYHHKKQ